MLHRSALGVCLLLLLTSSAFAQPPLPTETPLVRVADLSLGETQTVSLCDGSQAQVKLLELREERDAIRDAVRKAEVRVEVNGSNGANVALPNSSGDVFRHNEIYVPLGMLRPGSNRIEILAQLPNQSDVTCDTAGPVDKDAKRFLLLSSTEIRFPAIARLGRTPDLTLTAAGGFPYTEASGTLEINQAYSISSDSFPTNSNIYAPRIRIDVSCEAAPIPVPALGDLGLALLAALLLLAPGCLGLREAISRVRR